MSEIALCVALAALVLSLLRIKRPFKRVAVEGERFFLKDGAGHLHASLDLAGGSLPSLRFWRRDNSLAAALGVGPDEQPQLTLHDKEKMCRIRLAPDEDGSPRIYLYATDGTVRVQVTAVGEDAGLLVTDKRETPRVYLALQDGEPMLYFTNKEGERNVRLVVSRDGGGMLRTFGPDGSLRAEIGEARGGGGSFSLHDGAGRLAAEINALDGGGSIVTVNPNGEAIWKSPSLPDPKDK